MDGALGELASRAHVTNALHGPKQKHWMEGSQIDFYDQPVQVNEAVNAAHDHFQETLPPKE